MKNKVLKYEELPLNTIILRQRVLNHLNEQVQKLLFKLQDAQELNDPEKVGIVHGLKYLPTSGL